MFLTAISAAPKHNLQQILATPSSFSTYFINLSSPGIKKMSVPQSKRDEMTLACCSLSSFFHACVLARSSHATCHYLQRCAVLLPTAIDKDCFQPYKHTHSHTFTHIHAYVYIMFQKYIFILAIHISAVTSFSGNTRLYKSFNDRNLYRIMESLVAWRLPSWEVDSTTRIQIQNEAVCI